MSGPAEADLRRRLPSVEQVLQDPALIPLVERHGRTSVLRQIRRLLEEAREEAARGDAASVERLLGGLVPLLERRTLEAAAPSLVPVINATGVVVHTNLGRAPLSPDAIRHVARIAGAYSNLELDLASGQRGSREVHAEKRLGELLSAEGTVVVNNCAAAVLLAVNTIAEGREVIVSRGELVEIGGSFRIPDVLRKGGARLVEVGTTNRTRIADYRAALRPETAMVLRVHPSNFRIVGFTEAPDLRELAELAQGAGVPLVEDLGSGLLGPRPGSLAGEPTVAESLRAGADLVTFSGDKLLGGPQAGLVAGRRRLVEAMRKNPLYRALRVDKMTLAALDAVLTAHAEGRGAEGVPVLRMLALTREEIRLRAEAFAADLRTAEPGLVVEVIEGSSAVGGGAAPTASVPTALVAVSDGRGGGERFSADRLAAGLRGGDPPVLARVADDRLVIDLRTVAPEDETRLRDAVRRAIAAG
jgi:L-seryl-tRNA(Ser) seleniumtransferase